MKRIENWDIYNQKNILDARSYVSRNLYKLIQLFDIEEEFTIEEKEEILIDYITRFPDVVKRLQISFPERDGSTMVPKVQNIGGVYKYK